MDYVYICRSGDNEELRYSIRSVIANAPDGNVWLVGNKPDWYSGNFIPIKDVGGKFKNIANCLMAAASDDRISEDFVLMHDDFFILEKITNIPTLHGGLLASKIEAYVRLLGPNSYSAALGKANQQLRKLGIGDALDYDIHIPLVINSKKFIQLVPEESLAPMSMYGNLAKIGGTQIRDVKSYSSQRNASRSYTYNKDNSPYMSTDDRSFNSLYSERLRDQFPEPSPCEYPR